MTGLSVVEKAMDRLLSLPKTVARGRALAYNPEIHTARAALMDAIRNAVAPSGAIREPVAWKYGLDASHWFDAKVNKPDPLNVERYGVVYAYLMREIDDDRWVDAMYAFEAAVPQHQRGHSEWRARMEAALKVLNREPTL